MKKLLLLCTFVLLVSRLYADDYYWVGGGGSWSELSHWSSSSGGPANKSIIPGVNDDVYFDANSGLANNSTVTLPVTGHAYCRNISWAGVTTTAVFRNDGSYTLYIYGNAELSATMRYAIQRMTFVGSTNATYKMNGAPRLGVGFYNPFTVDKPGGSLTLLDAVPGSLVVSAITLTAGHLNMSGNTHSFAGLSSGASVLTRSLDISNATLILSGTWDFRGDNATLNATGSYIKAPVFHSDRYSFPKVDIDGLNTGLRIDNTTFGQLTFTSPDAATGSVRIGSNNTIDQLEFKGGGSIRAGGNTIKRLLLAPGKGYTLYGNNTVTELMQFNTPDCEALGEMTGGEASATITFGAGATANINNVYIKSLTVTGSIAPVTVVGADGGGNTGWNIQPRTGGATLYWVNGAGNWDDKSHWSATSGGTGGYCVPFSGDNVVFDANSGFGAGSNTVSLTGNAWCHNMTWTSPAAAPVFNGAANTLQVFGSVVLDPALTINASLLLRGTEASTLTSNGCNKGTLTIRIEKTGPDGGLTLTDNLAHPTASIALASGKLLMPNRTIQAAVITSLTTAARTVDISNATIVVDTWEFDAGNLSWVNNAAGSFITANGRLVTSGLTYPKLHFTGTGNVQLIGNTIAELVFSNTGALNSIIALSGSNTVGTLDIRGGGVELRGDNTINNLYLAPSRSYTVRNTQTITGLLRFNSPACNGLGELKGIAGTAATLSFGPAATLDFNNVYLQNLTATGAGVPIAVAGADAGGNTGFNITASDSGPRYWVGGSGDWNDGSHWSNTSGGPGGACVPTVANDVFFDANSFSSGSSAVTIATGNAYCRNMDWTGATFAPVFTKNSSVKLEIWGNLVMNPAVTMNAAVTPATPVQFSGPANTTITSNGSTLGDFDFTVLKAGGASVSLTDNFSLPLTRIVLWSGTLDMSGKTVVCTGITNTDQTGPVTLNITNANLTSNLDFVGPNKTLLAANSFVKAAFFQVNGNCVFDRVDFTGVQTASMSITESTFRELVFSNPASNSQAYLAANNRIGRLEFKGRGYIAGTGNIIDTLIFAPGKIYTFAAGTNTTINNEWYGSGSPCSPTEITSSATTSNATVTKTSGDVQFDYVRLRGITATGVTPFNAEEHSTDLGGNAGWNIAPYNGSAPITGLGPDQTLCADEFPYTLNTDGFFSSPLTQYTWNDGSTGRELIAANPGTYTVNVSFADGCAISDQITLTRSTVTVEPITGTNTVCTGATTTLASATPGGVWTTSDAAIATVSSTGVVTGVAAGAATITYTVTNSNGCSAAQTAVVTVKATPVVNDITGTLTIYAGAATTLSNTTPGGVWSSSNTAVATVDAAGRVKALAPGTADITYTLTTDGCSSSKTVTVTVSTLSVNITKTQDGAEPSTPGIFNISLPAGAQAAEDMTISYTVAGTATAGSDYTALAGTALIPAGAGNVDVQVTVVNDPLLESTETVSLTITAAQSASAAYTLSANNTAELDIADDDNTDANRVLSASNSGNAAEPSTAGSFTISLPSGVKASENISVSYTISGTATAGSDYVTLGGTAVIPKDQSSVTIPVTALDDDLMEQSETVILKITGGSSASFVFTPGTTNATATVEISDDENTAANRTLTVTKTGDGAEPAGSGGFSIALPSGVRTSVPVTVTYTVSGTAIAGSDYTTLAATATIAAGDNAVSIPITVIDDQFLEITETVILEVTGGSATGFTFTAGSANTATVNINDDDNTASNRVLSVSNTANGSEPSTHGSFQVSLPAGVLAAAPITVNYTTGGTATPGSDYATLSGTALIPAGQRSVSIPVTVSDDNLMENSETVTVTLTGGTSPGITFTPSSTNGSAMVTITDDENVAANRVLTVSAAGNAAEPALHSSFTISLPTGIQALEDITVTYTISGTAVNGADYAALSGTAVIPAGQSSVIVPLTVSDDALMEGDETAVLTLVKGVSASFNFTAGAGNSATITITDDDSNAANRVLSIVKAADAAEPSTNGGFTISLPAGVLASRNITVNYTISGTATAGTDYQAITGAVIIPAGGNGVNVPVNVIDNSVIEPAETVIMDITGGSDTQFAFTAAPGASSAIVDIADNDQTAGSNIVLLTKVSDAIEGGANGQYRISLPPGVTSSENVVVTFNTNTSTATASDYSFLGLSSGNIVIPAGANEVFIDVDAGNDGIIEGPENVVLNLTGAASASYPFTIDPSGNGAVVNIVDANAAATTPIQVEAGTGAAEPANHGSFTVRLAGGGTSAWPVTVGYQLSGTAVSGLDYQAFGNIVIPANTNAITVSLNVKDDKIIEPVENMTLTLLSGSATDGGGNAFIFPPDPVYKDVTLNIDDDDNANAANRVLSVEKTTDASEPSAHGAYTVKLPAGYSSAANITLVYAVGGTAVRNTDYTVSTLTLPANANSVTIPLTVIDDQIIEMPETVELALAESTDGNGFTYSVNPAAGTAFLNIDDDDNTDANRMLMVANAGDGAEPAINGNFKISLPANIKAAEDITVDYTIAGTATNGTDYTIAAQAVIPQGENSITVPVTVADDQVIEGNETVELTITGGASNNFSLTPSTGNDKAVVNIGDNDNTTANQTLTIVKIADAAEPSGTGSFEVRLPGSVTSAEPVTVNYSIAGSALPGADYETLSGSVVLPAGSRAVQIPLTVSDDKIIEGTETVVLTLTDAASRSFLFTVSSSSAEMNIDDDENTAANLVLAVANDGNAAEPGTSGLFTIHLPNDLTTAAPTTVNYTISGSATPDADYTALSGTATIPAGANGVGVAVNVLDEKIVEPLETVELTVTGGSSGSLAYTSAATGGTASLDIADNDNIPANLVLSVLRIKDAAEPSTTGIFSIQLPAGITVAEDVTVQYTIGGTAAAGADYAALSGTAIIPAGQPSVTVQVNVQDDKILEPVETVELTLNSGASGSFAFTAHPTATNASMNIADDDDNAANTTLTITKDTDAGEPGTSGSFTVSLPAGVTVTEDITVNYTISGTATPGADYLTLSGTVVIPAGQPSVSIPVTVTDDNIIEQTETVVLTLNGGTSASYTFSGAGNAAMDIRDDEATTPAKLVLTAAKEADAAEPGAHGSFAISLPATVTSSENITVNYTIAGTATAGTDYATLSGTVVIPAGQPGISVPVAVIDDHIIEPLETVTMTITGGASASFAFTTGSNAPVVEIADDDNNPANTAITVTRSADATEPSAAGSFTISLPATVSVTEDVTVTYTVAGTAGSSDYAPLSGTAVIRAGDNAVSIPLNVADDDIIEPTETVIITLTGASSASFAYTASGSATLDVLDNDANPANLVLSVRNEADGAEPDVDAGFTISLPAGLTTAVPVTVNYTISGTATPGSDYAALSGTATIDAGSNSVTVPVTIADDRIIESEETLIVTITGGNSDLGAYTAGPAKEATLHIADDDNANLELIVSAAAETFTISLASGNTVADPVTINYTISGTAIPGADYTAITGTITIPAGAGSVTVPVEVLATHEGEVDETVVFTLTGGTSAAYTYTVGTAGEAQVIIPPSNSDLLVTKELVAPAVGPYRIGQDLTYRITVHNSSNIRVTGVKAEDRLPAQLDVPSHTSAERGEVTVTPSTKLVEWNIGELQAGATVQMTLTSRLIDGGQVINEAAAYGDKPDTDSSNNTGVAEIVVEGQDLFFPNTFTPNGDGKNEKFIIGGLEKYTTAALYIFNRWGGQVYQSKDYRNDWTGSDLNEGTYFYILEVKKPDGIKKYKGWVTIIR